MKKLPLLFIFTLIIGSQLFSQTYRKLVEDGKTWSIVTEIVDDISTSWISFGADTIINNETYKRVLVSDNPSLLPSYCFGFIREDSTKKVYFMNNSYEEGLLYDFNVSIGDTVPIDNTFSWPNCLEDLTAVVDTIFYSSILTIENNCNYLPPVFNPSFLDNSERKIIIVRKIDSEDQLDYWIEGIGSISGILESCSHFKPCLSFDCDPVFAYHYLLCHFEGENHIYELDELYYGCHISVNTNYVEINEISVFPNPVTENVFTIEFGSHFTGNLILINAFGNTVLKKTVNSSASKISVELPNIPTGLYYLMATDFLGNIHTLKIIVK
jgi:hypothetical protein